MIQKLINSKLLNDRPTESITSAAFIIALAGIVSRLLGLVRDRILAFQFGAGDTLDVYYAAFRIPDLIYNLLIVGALGAAFIPVFTGLLTKKREEEAWQMAATVLNLSVLILSCLSVVLAVFAPSIMRLITPGFSPEKINSVVMFTRIMFLSPLLLGVSGIFGGILVSFKKFLLYSMAPIFYNVGIIIGAMVLARFMGPAGLAWGVVLGAFMHMLIQYPSVRSSGFRFLPTLFRGFSNGEVREVLSLMIPRTLAVAITQVNLTVITIFASTLSSGSLSVFNFANNIQSAPLGLFGISFAIAVFPTLSAYASQNAKIDFVRVLSEAVRQILFFVIPISVVLIVLRAQIVRIILGSGKFDWEDTILTLSTLGILSVSLFAQSLIPLLARSFYALHNTRTPFFIALASEAVNILLVIVLIDKYAVAGLAMAFSTSSILNMLLLFFFLRREFDAFDEVRIITSTLKIIVASVLAGFAIQVSKNIVSQFFELDTFLNVFVQLVVSLGMGVAVFSVLSMLLEIEEFTKVRMAISKKLFGVKRPITEDASEVSGL